MDLTNPDILSIKDVAVIFGVSANAVRQAIALGQLPNIQVGLDEMISRAVVEEMLGHEIVRRDPDSEAPKRQDT